MGYLQVGEKVEDEVVLAEEPVELKSVETLEVEAVVLADASVGSEVPVLVADVDRVVEDIVDEIVLEGTIVPLLQAPVGIANRLTSRHPESSRPENNP